jgi:D-glycero-D-manno-heptose 1,7-bisphosphate phosphatase
MKTNQPAVFLDRDGVVIEDSHYLGDRNRVRLIPGSAEAVARLNRAGWPVVIVTNQSGVARGLFTEDDVDDVHAHLAELLRGYGARIDAFHFCPHHPEAEIARYRADCDCRKPQPGMLLRAAGDLGIDLAASWMIGDRVTDLEAGAAVGCRTVLVRTGYGTLVNPAGLDRDALNLELVAIDLADAVAKLGLTSLAKCAA